MVGISAWLTVTKKTPEHQPKLEHTLFNDCLHRYIHFLPLPYCLSSTFVPVLRWTVSATTLTTDFILSFLDQSGITKVQRRVSYVSWWLPAMKKAHGKIFIREFLAIIPSFSVSDYSLPITLIRYFFFFSWTLAFYWILVVIVIIGIIGANILW